MPRPSRARRVGFAAITLLMMLIATLLVLEVGLRVAFVRSTDLAIEMWKYAVQLKQPVDDAELGFGHVPNGRAFLMGVEIRTNSAGLRDAEMAVDAPDDVYRIWMLGDSTTLGWGATIDSTVPKLLEQELARAIPATRQRFQVINAGVGNYNTVQEVASYRRQGRLYEPDLVVLTYFINDAEVAREMTDGFLTHHSYALTFVASRLDALLRTAGVRPAWKPYYRSLYEEERPGWIAAKRALQTLRDITRNDQTSLLVAILPELREINGDYPFAEQHGQIKHALLAARIPALDLLPSLKRHGREESLFVAAGDPHPNRKANLLVAARLREWIVQEILVRDVGR